MPPQRLTSVEFVFNLHLFMSCYNYPCHAGQNIVRSNKSLLDGQTDIDLDKSYSTFKLFVYMKTFITLMETVYCNLKRINNHAY